MDDQQYREFARRYEEAHHLYEQDDFDGALSRGQALLAETHLPSGLRMHALILVAASHPDWYYVKQLLQEARQLLLRAPEWRNECPGSSGETTAAIFHLRRALESLQDLHQVRRPDMEDRQ